MQVHNFLYASNNYFTRWGLCCFGYVYEGIEVVDKIATTVPVTDNNGTVEASNQPVITSIKMLK